MIGAFAGSTRARCRARARRPCTKRGLAHRASGCARSPCCPRSPRCPNTATAASAACCSSSACSDPAPARGCDVAVLRLRIEDRELVRRELGRAVQLAVGVDGRIAPIRAAQVVHVRFVGRPVAHGRDDVALDAARPRRLGVRQLALRDALGPIGEILRRHAAELVHRGREHLLARLARLNAPHPRVVMAR